MTQLLTLTTTHKFPLLVLDPDLAGRGGRTGLLDAVGEGGLLGRLGQAGPSSLQLNHLVVVIVAAEATLGVHGAQGLNLDSFAVVEDSGVGCFKIENIINRSKDLDSY